MIVFAVYFLLLVFLIYKNQFFGILQDDVLNKRFYLTAFTVKVSGLLFFYLVYTKLYGTVLYSDTYDYYRDSKVIYSIAQWDLGEFFKVMFGLQDDGPETQLFQNYLRLTSVWDESKDELLYNDNRLMLRFHALVHFISFGNYYVHALVCSFMGFLGINWIYKSFKQLFKGKEILLFSVWLLFPGLWFWSSSFLKEGPALFCMGMLCVSFYRIIALNQINIKNVLMFSIVIVLSFLFKQYVMLPLCFFTLLFFIIQFRVKPKSLTGVIYFLLITGSFVTMNILVKAVKDKTIVEALAERQHTFLDMSEGGLFLLDSTKFVRLPYDTTLIRSVGKINSDTSIVTIRKGANYMYWEHSHQKDTLYCKGNDDTNSVYKLFYVIKKAKATLPMQLQDGSLASFLKATPYALYITIAKPLFMDARNNMDIMTSFENIFILTAIFLALFFTLRFKFYSPWLWYFISIILVVLLLIGITSPNLGAIQRYRVLIIPFLFMCTLLLYRGKWQLNSSKFFKNASNN